ncbi:YcaO-like family protein [Paenarthrobacter ureafaciens]|uniref:YcaO-like family protein n=1 Tax=Paenarthrobacter ureafaciens TaxID=37931 RepID=UPI001916E75D|nr:YcaO-like family protein [Paenarthrobacter ureafaciens]QQQ61876.1 YcaO-like family protein [Paenarthrobacter ureafaciens]
MNPGPVPNLDPVLTLDPALGLVSESTVYPPNDVGLWRTVAMLANGEITEHGFASAVGAFDVSRRRSLMRGAGEAVERYALVPASADAEHLHVQDDVGRRIDFVTGGLGRASALACDLPWYRASNLLTGGESRVPGPVVDYWPGASTVSEWDRLFDPSPNGAASGPSRSFAQASGLAEVIERDAFLTSWCSGAPLQKIDIRSLPASPTARNLAMLTESALANGVKFTLAVVPSAAPMVVAACFVIGVNESAPFGAVGLKAAAGPGSALLGALQEGLQIRELFLSRRPSSDAGGSVTDDASRADFWNTASAVARLEEWVRSFPLTAIPEGFDLPGVNHLATYFAGRNISPQWVDLTHRLPAAIRNHGWHAGKVVCPGAVQLSMDETKSLAPHRPGIVRSQTMPHPLI